MKILSAFVNVLHCSPFTTYYSPCNEVVRTLCALKVDWEKKSLDREEGCLDVYVCGGGVWMWLLSDRIKTKSDNYILCAY